MKTLYGVCDSNTIYSLTFHIPTIDEFNVLEETKGVYWVKNGIWIKQGDNIIKHKPYNGGIVEGLSYFRILVEPNWIKDYGKTWALTKEELENA